MKKLISTILFVLTITQSYSQTVANALEANYLSKTYIFNYYEKIVKSDNLGEHTGKEETALLGSLFTVVRVLDKTLVIKFNDWSSDTSAKNEKNRLKYLKYNDDLAFFVLDKTVFKNSCSEYVKKWDITFGTFTTPFKIRLKPFLFTTDLNLGASISFKRRFSREFCWGGILGLSLSSVKLDSLSTNGFVKTPTDRPAITPSINALIGYRNINLMLGFGIDYISQTSNIEANWVYHKKPWFGVGIGVSLFNKQTDGNSTNVDAGQK